MTEPRNVAEGLLRTAREHAESAAFRTLSGETWTWREYLDRIARFAGGLRALGVEHGDRVVVMMGNRLEFHVADAAAMVIGATPISIYNSSSPEQIAYLAGHCDAVTAITEAGDYVERFQAAVGDLPRLR
jgi:long-chain acyl-CoA synthetase